MSVLRSPLRLYSERMSMKIECPRCGEKLVPMEIENCHECTWPFRETGWAKWRGRIHRITIDSSCINEKQKDPSLNTLERWAEKGLIKIERADAMLAELKGEQRIEKARVMPPHPGLFTLDVSCLDGGDVLAGPEIPDAALKDVLFPSAKTLNEKQKADIRHLKQVVRTGSDCFVTINTRDFIRDGRREKLVNRFGIWVFTPEEIVGLLRKQWPDHFT